MSRKTLSFKAGQWKEIRAKMSVDYPTIKTNGYLEGRYYGDGPSVRVKSSVVTCLPKSGGLPRGLGLSSYNLYTIEFDSEEDAVYFTLKYA